MATTTPNTRFLFVALVASFALAAAAAANDLYLDPIWVNGPEFPMGQRLYHRLVQDSKGNIWTFGGVDSSNIF